MGCGSESQDRAFASASDSFVLLTDFDISEYSEAPDEEIRRAFARVVDPPVAQNDDVGGAFDLGTSGYKVNPRAPAADASGGSHADSGPFVVISFGVDEDCARCCQQREAGPSGESIAGWDATFLQRFPLFVLAVH